MSAAEVLHQHASYGLVVAADGKGLTNGCTGCGWRGDIDCHAAHQLDALKAAGYAVVKLPKQCIIPTGWGDDCLGAWPSGQDDPVSAWPRRQVATPDDKWLDPHDARELAAALMAAANAAEANL